MSESQKRQTQSPEPVKMERERTALSLRIERTLETPMVVLGFVWLILLVVDLSHGLSPFLTRVSDFIWILFIIDFLFRFAVAPRKLIFLRRSILTMVSLVLPALRVFRVFQAVRLLRLARATRSVRLVRIITSLNRGMRALSRSMGRRGLGYVVATTVIVLVTGAAGVLAFERDVVHPAAPSDFGAALWWTAMILTTMGSDFWPQTPEGRILCFLLSVYAFSIFGYVTAALATFFIGRDANDEQGELAGQQEIRALREEVAALRRDLAGSLPGRDFEKPGETN